MKFNQIFDKYPITQAEYWACIEYIGGIMWRLKHDYYNRRPWATDEDIEKVEEYSEIQEELVREACEKFNITFPKDEENPKYGKQNYWDWYRECRRIIESGTEEERKKLNTEENVIKTEKRKITLLEGE